MSNVKAAIYARFSSHNQTEMSIKAQVRACKEYAKSHNIEVVEVYADEAKSATSTNRPEFQRMLVESGNNNFDIILIHKTDRFARNQQDAITCKAILERNGVKVVSVTEQFDDSPEGFMLETVISGMAQYYSMNLGREVKKGQKEAALQSLFLGGTPPFGYKIVDRKYQIDDFKAEAVKLIFNMYCEGYSYKKIALELNNKGYSTQRGEQFSKNSIRNILTNERYTGTYIYNQRKGKSKYTGKRNNSAQKDKTEIIKIDGGIPQIISKEQFVKAQDIIKKHEHLRGGKKHRYILSGKVKCGCGGLMHGNTRRSGRNKQQHSYYRCNKCCQEVNVKYLDRFVIRCISKSVASAYEKDIHRLTEDLNEYIDLNSDDLNSDLHALKMAIDGNNKKLNNLTDKLSYIEDNNRQSHTIMNKITELEKSNQRLTEQKDKLEENLKLRYTNKEVNQAYKSILKHIKDNDTIAVRNFINDYVNEVTVDKENDIITVKID